MDAPARIIDANANRAREGVRTLEDLARFALDDAALAARCKRVRHAITSGVEALPLAPGALTGARDSAGDVGATLPDLGRASRSSLAGIASAASGRAGEALRVIEEMAGVLGAPGEAFARARYEVYELARAIATALSARAPQWRLCLVLTESLCAGRDPAAVALGAVRGGADCVQIREKDADARAMVDLTRRVIERVRPLGAAVIVNDRADVALAAGADGVHVGQHDLPVDACRRVLGAGAIVGVSTSNLDDAKRALADGASYCGCGSMFASSTKPKPQLAGAAYLRAYLEDPVVSAMPHLAIGGITAENAGELARVGCLGVAISGAICSAPDPEGAARAIREALDAPVRPAAPH